MKDSASLRKKKISIVMPVLNERENIWRAYEALIEELDKLAAQYTYEIIITDNHSTDGTDQQLLKLAAQDPCVKVIRFSRNFGFQRSLLTAYRVASGDLAIQIDCDLQDPPALIPVFLEWWEAGHDVVVGIRAKRKEGWLLQFGRRGYYWLLATMEPDQQLVENAGDFRLVDRSILDHLKRVNDAHPYVRGLTSSLARSQKGVAYERNTREFGRSKFPLKRLFGFAAEGIVSHSRFPLRLAVYTGSALFLLSLGVATYYALLWLIAGQEWPAGFATTTLLLLVSIGLNGIFVGIVGEYVGRIYEQVRFRPVTIVEWSMNVDELDLSPPSPEEPPH